MSWRDMVSDEEAARIDNHLHDFLALGGNARDISRLLEASNSYDVAGTVGYSHGAREAYRDVTREMARLRNEVSRTRQPWWPWRRRA